MSVYSTPDFEQKICPPEQLAQRLASLPRPLVFTNGCFDILHRGHVTYLAQAAAQGASMIVALNTDASVKRQGKGDDRPINNLANRAAVMAALGCVSLVTWFDEDTPFNLIMAVKPDVLIKGGDWTPENIVGSKEVMAWGGAVHSIPFLYDTSTTKTLERIRAAEEKMTIKQNVIIELYRDILETGILTTLQISQIATVCVVLLVAYVLLRAVRQRLNIVSLGGADWPWVLFPFTAYVLLNLASPLLQSVFNHPLKLIGVADLLLLAMFSIRLLVYLLRHVFTGAWLPRWERIIAALIWVTYALHAVGILPEMAKSLDEISFHVGKSHISLLTIFQAIASVGMTLLAALWLGRVIERRLLATEFIDLNVRVVLNKIIRAGLLVLAVMIALPLVGIDLTILSVFGGALGVGLGFGLQKIASNYVSGFIILLDRSIKLGDLILVEGRQGTVAELTSRYIVLKMLDGTDVLIPNEALVTSTVVNLSYKDRKVAMNLPVQVAYGTDLELALRLLAETSAGLARLAVDPAPGAVIKGFADNGINLELTVWVRDPENGTGGLRSDLNMRIWQAFQQHGIQMPFPQRDVRIVSSAATES